MFSEFFFCSDYAPTTRSLICSEYMATPFRELGKRTNPPKKAPGASSKATRAAISPARLWASALPATVGGIRSRRRCRSRLSRAKERTTKRPTWKPSCTLLATGNSRCGGGRRSAPTNRHEHGGHELPFGNYADRPLAGR